MKIRAVIFDVYGTLLEVGPPPGDADAQWVELWQEYLHGTPPATRLQFLIACQRVVARRHAAARNQGIAFPEMLWPDVVGEVIPEFARLPAGVQSDFLWRHIGTGHTTRLFPGAAAALRALQAAGCLLGIASNAQAYTLRELSAALAVAGLDDSLFTPALCFWSFEHGFSKPDPHVFAILTARLAARGVPRDAILMVGDRPDNDITPARLHGWHTWHLARHPAITPGGDWERWLEQFCPANAAGAGRKP